jgi:NAD(P)H dehydrogenase (quinone)
MILLTGAAGKTGRAVLKALVKREAAVRVFVRSRDQASELLQAGATEALLGDFTNIDALHTAVKGVKSIYHICPNMHPAEVEIGRSIIDLAAENGVKLFVYHSVLHPQTEKMPHHWNKLRVEELLFESGLDFTILQPAPYMQNILASREEILKKGLYRAPYPAATALSLIDLQDLGEVAAIVLTGEGYANAVYELAGTEALTQEDLVNALTAETGRTVRYEEVNLADWQKAAAASGSSEYGIGTLTKMFNYYAVYGLKGNSNNLCWLLGRQPHSIEEFIKRDIIAH